MSRWIVERTVHFAPGDLVRHGFVHFGFHDRSGRHYLIDHQRHFLGLIAPDDRLAWTVAAQPVFPDTPNIEAELEFPSTWTRYRMVRSSSRTWGTRACSASTRRP